MVQSGQKTSNALLEAKPADYVYQPCSVSDLRFQQGFCGERFDSYRSAVESARVALSHDQTVAPAGYLLIPWFGKLHYISPALYKRDAKKYHELHWKEAWNLQDSIRSNREIFDEWANPRRFFNSFVAGTVERWQEARAAWDEYIHDVESAPKPDIHQFNALLLRTGEVINRLVAFNYEADQVAKNGFDLQAIRQDSQKLLEIVRKYRENCISSAEQITAGLETVESTAFQILNIVPIITFMDPFREAAYKISVLLVRAGARGTGGYLADGTLDGALREVFAILEREAPGVIVDVILIPVSRLCLRLGMGRIAREACVLAVKHIIEFCCAYYKLAQKNADGKLTDQQLEQVLSERLAVLVGDIAGIFLGVSRHDKTGKVIIKSVVDSVIRTLLVDINNARMAAKEQNREMIEVLLSDLPGTIVRIIEGAVIGLIQRRAQQTSQYIEQQRAAGGGDQGEGLTYREGAQILQRTNVSEWARDGTVDAKTLRSIQESRRPPLRRWDHKTYTGTAWSRTKLDYRTAAEIRRFAHNNNLIVISHAPAKTRTMHTDSTAERGAKAPKPMEVKAKTSDHPNAPGGKLGLVTKPVAEGEPGGPTHNDFAAAMKQWDASRQDMFAHGHMVREDGVVFNPDQLTNWGKLHQQDAADCTRAVAVLKQIAAAGYQDLATVPPAKLSGKLAAQLEEIRPILNKAKIGFYSDLDLIEVIDFSSGARRFMGDKGDGTDALHLARDNRQHLSEAINIHNDYDDTDIPEDVRVRAKRGDAVQHGGSSEIEPLELAKTFDNVNVPIKQANLVFPEGELKIIDETDPYVADKIKGLEGQARVKRLDWAIRDRIEQELKMRLGDKYQDFANRAQNVRKAYEKASNLYTPPSQPPPPVTPKQVGTVRSSYMKIEVLDEPGLGNEVTKEDIEKSLLSRHMLLEGYKIERACESAMNKSPKVNLPRLWYGSRVLVAVDREPEPDEPNNRNIVIAVSHYEQSIADAIEGLMRARQELGALSIILRVWYELYTAYCPTATDYVANRIGGRDPGLKPRHEELAAMISCFRPRKDERLYAFSVTKFAPTYAPTAHKSALDKRPVQGLVLNEVWEHLKTKKLTYRKVEMAGGKEPLLVFPESVIAYQPH